jgi:hypothetical protein
LLVLHPTACTCIARNQPADHSKLAGWLAR